MTLVQVVLDLPQVSAVTVCAGRPGLDLELARQLQEEETKQEKEEFKKLQVPQTWERRSQCALEEEEEENGCGEPCLFPLARGSLVWMAAAATAGRWSGPWRAP